MPHKPMALHIAFILALLLPASLLGCAGPIQSVPPTGPQISISPTSAAPGVTITVAGSGFAAAGSVSIFLNKSSAENVPANPIATARADANGAFTASFALPAAWPDGAPLIETHIVILATSADGKLKATAALNLQTQAAGEPYINAEGDFSLLLPPGWTVSEPRETPAGSVYTLGPAPLIPGPANSTVIVADARNVSIEAALKQACSGCAPLPRLDSIELNGMPAQRALISAGGGPAVEWFFVERGGRLIYFTIHDPQSFQTLAGVVQSLSFGSVAGVDPQSSPAAYAARETLARELSVPAESIAILTVEAAEWPDSCLGLQLDGDQCDPIKTAGYTGLLGVEAGPTYEFRADAAGSRVRLVPGAAAAVMQLLAVQLQVDFPQVRLARVERVQWPDGCLGAPAQGENCTQAITPGYKVIVESGGQRYEYHTDALGEQLRLAAAPNPDLKDVVVEWKLAAPRCQTAAFNPQTMVFGFCQGALMAAKYPNPQRAADLAYYLKTYAPFEAGTPAGQLVFRGQGKTVATPAEQRMIAEWARLTYIETSAGDQSGAAGLALVWHREGGVAGFCDDLMVEVSGRYAGALCKGRQPTDLGGGRLNAEQVKQLFAWTDALKSFEVELTDQAKADAMTIRLTFAGAGGADASDAEKQAISDFASRLFASLQK
jgi:hypothetical protein